MLATLYPASSPQAQQTVNLVNHLRHDLIPGAEQGTSLVVHVGGATGGAGDMLAVIRDRESQLLERLYAAEAEPRRGSTDDGL